MTACEQLSFLKEAHQTIIHGDCLEEMKKMPENSIDFIVTDPPYGLSFMNKKWDAETPDVYLWKEALRVCKSGSMIAVFGGSRTHHRLMCAIEDAGFEIRDVIMWLYGSGFPKSHNKFGLPGYGTALKPAYEPIILAMKPLDGTYAQNAEKWGLAGINIDGCRIEFSSKQEAEKHAQEWDRNWTSSPIHAFDKETGNHPGAKRETGDGPRPQKGRWPANLLLDEESAEMMDQQSGILKSGIVKPYKRSTRDQYSGSFPDNINDFPSSSGGASRFFYCAKASSRERNKGCEGMPLKPGGSNAKGFTKDVANGLDRNKPVANHHPTVKPISLMKYIIKLLAPPGNPICLDPFAGSGSTLVAARELGIDCIGIEKEEQYAEIAKARIA